MTLWKGVYRPKNLYRPRNFFLPSEKSKIHWDFQHCSMPIWFTWLIYQLSFTVPIRVSPCVPVACLRSWSTGLTLGKYTCNNVQLRRCKQTNALIITSVNYLYLHAEQLFKTNQQFIRKNFKIMSMNKRRFWVLTCKDLIHNEVFHNKLLLTFLFNFLFSRTKTSFYSIYIICLISHKTDMRNM